MTAAKCYATVVASAMSFGISLDVIGDKTRICKEVSRNGYTLGVVWDRQHARRGHLPTVLCPKGGLLLGTVGNGYAGRMAAKCVDCGKAMDYYIESAEQKVWKLDPVDSKGVHLDA